MSKGVNLAGWGTSRPGTPKMHSLWALFSFVLLALAGCVAPGPSSATRTEGDGATMAAYAGYKAAWQRQDVAAIVDYYQPGATLDNPAAGGAVSGPALVAWLQGLFAAIPDFKVEVVSAYPLRDHRVADQWVIRGTWTKPFPGGPLAGAQPSGKSFRVPGSSFYEWKDGKIVSGVQYFDQMAFLTQIGVIGGK